MTAARLRCGFGSCGSHALFGLVQADYGDDGQAEQHIVPELDASEAEQQRRGDEGDADEAIDSEMHAIGQHSEYTEMVVRQQRQYKGRDAGHDGQPECQTIAATQAKQKRHGHEVNTNEGEQ
ncbi:hypothetical protein SAMN06265368_2601 [Cohaesibacter gelatinilyticus]|uniref:Uncharacterized protein n=1 Tax=Cohaesibacter gelatinilyticus TaxID=372072 RepID=A0A285PCT5_9HYPH|nr:hypothetical protein SAMN06265368_2601 [Cohaesibacter gelatinilyticus]